ncbi:hypothetical protein [Cedecea sp.]|jgi:hypothetical protein|uniref:hypothetical protein n=1 Tax=Cedecea sp. TaxID=1970739 RepID=UPI002F4165D8
MMNNPRYILQRLIPVHQQRMMGYEHTLKGYQQQLNDLIEDTEGELQNIQSLMLEYQQNDSAFQIASQQRVMSFHLLISKRLHLKSLAEDIALHNQSLRNINARREQVCQQITVTREQILFYNKKLEKIRQTLLLIKD